MEIDLLIEGGAWDEALLSDWLAAGATATLDILALDPAAFSLSVLATDDARIAALNGTFRGKPVPTNVLSWPSEERGASVPGGRPKLDFAAGGDGPYELGDLALAHETCAREAQAAGKPFADHVRHLVVHGVLHLLGFDHEHDADAAVMESLETQILARLGVSDPY